MTTVVPIKNNSIKYINGDLDVRAGYLGESISITNVTTNVSIAVGVAPLSLTKYYNSYSIQTETAITLTLPTSSQVSIGWYTRIDLISNTGAGSITILNGVTPIGNLNSNASFTLAYSSANVTLISSTTYSVLYSMPLYGAIRQVPVITQNGMLCRSTVLACFYSYCDVAGGTTIDANTLVDVPLRWINPTGQFIDSTYYTVASNTRITQLQAGSYKYSGLIGINNVLLGTQANIRIRPRLNGTTFLNSFSIVTGTILPFAAGTYMFDGVFSLAANDYIEIMVGKTAINIGGSNPVDLANTSMTVQLVGQ